MLICTHLDRDHVHSHFIVNSVSFETGRKFHISTPELEPIRQRNEALCMEYGFEICKAKAEQERRKSMSIAEYHAAAKGESWNMRLLNTIDSCMKHAASKAQFIELMELEGYSVKWTDSRKSITYTTPQGMICRDDRLHETRYLKERMVLELQITEEIINGRTQTWEQTLADRAYTATADLPLLPHDTGEDGQSLLQPEFNLGWDCRFTESNSSGAKAKSADQNTTNSLPTRSELEEISQSLTIIQQALAQAGKKKEKHFSMSRFLLSRLSWTPLWIVIPLLAVIWFSLGGLWKGWIMLPQ